MKSKTRKAAGASGRPLHLTSDTPTLCCGARLLIECDGTYRCPCGKRQERLAKATICANLLDTPNDTLSRFE